MSDKNDILFPERDKYMNFIMTSENIPEKEIVSIDSCECDHDFEFIECFGTFCKKCQIGYGVECLYPKCKVHHCNKHSLSYETFSEHTFSAVDKNMTDDIYCLHLGHDGVIDGKVEDIHRVLSYPGLKIVEYCGYYTDTSVIDIFDSDRYSHITFNPIL